MSQSLSIETPLEYSVEMSRRLGREVYVKYESLQPSGSFKIRGIGNLMQKAVASGVKRFICSSGGNAGVAAAYAGCKLNTPVQVIVPTSTPSYMADIMKNYGAEVIVHGAVWAEADEYARSLLHAANIIEENSAVYVPPFDHADIWEGNSSMVEEIQRQLPAAMERCLNREGPVVSKPAAVVLCVGGGGLLAGVCEGMQQADWNDVPIIAAETQGAASFAASVQARSLVRIPAIKTLAVTLGASQVASDCMFWAGQRVICPIVVSDAEAVVAVSQFAVDHRVLVEPSCGAALAALDIVCSSNADNTAVDAQWLWARQAMLPVNGPIILIACGGNMVSPALISRYNRLVDVEDQCEAIDWVPFAWKEHTSFSGKLHKFFLKNKVLVTLGLSAVTGALGYFAGSYVGFKEGVTTVQKE